MEIFKWYSNTRQKYSLYLKTRQNYSNSVRIQGGTIQTVYEYKAEVLK